MLTVENYLTFCHFFPYIFMNNIFMNNIFSYLKNFLFTCSNVKCIFNLSSQFYYWTRSLLMRMHKENLIN